ncbi:BRISC and BRCA1-A complex member 2-like [Hydractinia symbiolongicarpus]|uniref:BRISC and BRCA1-A complex member 2-like n=1 Tax=Hydractinia symbiolongicarpus TaxID=13093 RepID=UPI00254B6D3A|nr:BRISC and BRCA1-A complex member 2-like [Hydractinia symbiolongicarpus]
MADVSFQRLLVTLTTKLKNHSLGLRGDVVIVKDVKHSKLSACSNHIFDVSFLVAGMPQNWQLIFNPEHPLLAPDVIFDNKSFFPDIQLIEGFTAWNTRSDECLVALITDLFEAYLKHQRSAILEYPQVKNSFEEFMKTTKFGSRCEIDILKNGPGTFNDVIKLMISLDVNFSKLPPYLQPKNVGDNCCCLSFVFEPPNLSTIKPVLELSPAVEIALGGISNLRIPPYGTSTLVSYTKKISDLLENTVSDVIERYERRKSLIILLLSELNGSVIEYDTETFCEASFLLEVEGFHFILIVMLSEQFPHEEPSIALQPIYQMSNHVHTMSVKDCTHDPHMSSEQILTYIRESVNKSLQEFKKNSLS